MTGGKNISTIPIYIPIVGNLAAYPENIQTSDQALIDNGHVNAVRYYRFRFAWVLMAGNSVDAIGYLVYQVFPLVLRKLLL
jgi:hypothetical protein